MESQNGKKNESKWNQYPTIEEQKKLFKNFSSLPFVIAALIAIFGLIGGIAGAVATASAGMFFGIFFGAVVAALITFVILRILISSQVLTVLYLEKISKQMEDMQKRSEGVGEDMKTNEDADETEEEE